MLLKEKIKLYLKEVRERKYEILHDSGFLIFDESEEYLKQDSSLISEENQYDIDNGKWLVEDSKKYCKK